MQATPEPSRVACIKSAPGALPTTQTDSDLNGQQPIEERAVALECEPQVLSRDVITSAPLLFELAALLCKHPGEALHHLGHQTIRLLDGGAGFVDETGLDLDP